MKQLSNQLLGLALVIGFVACNDSANTTKATSTSDQTGNTVSNNTSGGAQDTTSMAAGSTTSLNAQDSTFAMKAATGGMMEVEAGNTAQQAAQNARVKAFGAMMVKDHSTSNKELMSIVAGRMEIPQTLPPEHQTHVTELKSLKGKAFDNRYMTMMVADHEKTLADFEKQANAGADPALKAFAAKNLPILRMHRDSATAINQAIK